jgi:hypothetical protein
MTEINKKHYLSKKEIIKLSPFESKVRYFINKDYKQKK